MGKRGPKAIPDDVKQLRGTDRKDRSHPRAVPALRGGVRIPPWLEGLGLELWHEKTATYLERGMNIVGCESMLAQYCAYEAMTIECWQAYYRWDPASEYPRPNPPSASQENALKNLASQYYDTFASQYASKQPAGPQSESESYWDNRFKVIDGGKGAA
jgi:hypothetical protein